MSLKLMAITKAKDKGGLTQHFTVKIVKNKGFKVYFEG